MLLHLRSLVRRPPALATGMPPKRAASAAASSGQKPGKEEAKKRAKKCAPKVDVAGAKEVKKKKEAASGVNDGITRCHWAGSDPVYCKYHDEEWGRPVVDDRTLFEFLILEGAQAGLSWITILKRRDAYWKAYDGFDIAKVAGYGEEKKAWLLTDESGIVKNRLKVKASVANAQVALEVIKEKGSLHAYLMGFMPGGEAIVNEPPPHIATSPQSDEISKDLKKRGMSFVGSTIIYAYMQAVGMVVDHEKGCHLAGDPGGKGKGGKK